VKRGKSKFFDSCHFADPTSRTCTQNAGGDYCGMFRTLSKLEEKEKGTKSKKKGNRKK
jgi:hypothetical protein